MNYGLLTLFPSSSSSHWRLSPSARWSRLFSGRLTLTSLLTVWGFAQGWMDAFFRVATDRDHQWVFMVCALFGSLIALLGASHGTLGFSKWLSRLCRGPRSTLFITWVMGILIFCGRLPQYHDAEHALKKQTDRNKVPREALSYAIDSTGAPVCAILPFSTWAVFFSGLFFAEQGVAQLGYGSAIETFYHVIPFAFYAIAAVVIVPLFGFGLLPKMGRMRTAYLRAERTGQVYSPESRELNLEDEDDEAAPGAHGNILDFVVPIGVLIVLAIAGGELFLAVLAAIAVCFVLYIPRKKLSVTRFCDLAMHGFCNMIPTVAIIFFAFVMQEAMSDIGIAAYVVINAVRPLMSAPLFPVITFAVVALLNFSTGSVWGIPAIVTPIILPLAFSIGANPLVVMGAIVSGATLGSHMLLFIPTPRCSPQAAAACRIWTMRCPSCLMRCAWWALPRRNYLALL